MIAAYTVTQRPRQVCVISDLTTAFLKEQWQASRYKRKGISSAASTRYLQEPFTTQRNPTPPLQGRRSIGCKTVSKVIQQQHSITATLF